MDININQKRLPAPTDIKIAYTKVAGQSIITWSALSAKNYIVSYNVYRGTSSNGIFYKLNKQPISNNSYIDYALGRNPNTTYWYKLSTLYKTDNGFVEGMLSKPVQYHVTTVDKWFNKINERNMWILKNTGQLFDLYTRKYEGETCTNCYDKARGRAGMDSCTTCFGTGFVGGYEPEVQLYLRLSPAEESLDVATEDLTYNSLPSAWTITPIKINNRDLLIGQDGTIYSVLSMFEGQAAGYLFHQELKLKTLDPYDNRYNINRATLRPAY